MTIFQISLRDMTRKFRPHRRFEGDRWRSASGIEQLRLFFIHIRQFSVKMLWNKQGVRDGDVIEYSIDVTRIWQLHLLVTDRGDGTGADWGVWIEPTLLR